MPGVLHIHHLLELSYLYPLLSSFEIFAFVIRIKIYKTTKLFIHRWPKLLISVVHIIWADGLC